MSYQPAVKVIDQNWLPSSLTIDEGMLMTNNYLYAVSMWNIPGHISFKKLWYNNVVSNTLSTMRPNNTRYTFPTASIQMRVISTNAADSSAWTWIRTVIIKYLDTNYIEQTEIVTMNGTTAVLTVATNILRINDFYSVTRWTSLWAVGTISLQNAWWTVTYARIIPTYNWSQQLVFTVPAWKRLMLKKISLSTGSAAWANFIECRLKFSIDNDWVRQTDWSMWTQYFGMLQAWSLIEWTDMLYLIPEKTDIVIDIIWDSATSWIATWYIEGFIE